jgi:hypothetical protein
VPETPSKWSYGFALAPVVIKTQWMIPELLAQNPILLPQVLDRLLLALFIQPAIAIRIN